MAYSFLDEVKKKFMSNQYQLANVQEDKQPVEKNMLDHLVSGASDVYNNYVKPDDKGSSALGVVTQLWNQYDPNSIQNKTANLNKQLLDQAAGAEQNMLASTSTNSPEYQQYMAYQQKRADEANKQRNVGFKNQLAGSGIRGGQLSNLYKRFVADPSQADEGQMATKAYENYINNMKARQGFYSSRAGSVAR